MWDNVLAALATEDPNCVWQTCFCTVIAVGGGFGSGGFFKRGAFAGGEEEIGLDGVLLGVEV
ncbi:MAG TPA: hypothetical protein VNB49_19165, partial [Candidatus Dormibacteraeota bacterium]|nr:hypothetical protein [Candidatus Dormibacteraeota bacterium]